MKKANRIWLGVGFAVLLLIAWAVAAGSSPTRKQADLIERADGLMSDKIYVRAMPLLEEAAGYKGRNTIEAETRLKVVYLALMGQSGIRNKYVALLEKQMKRSDATAQVFTEAAEFYILTNKRADALNILRQGIAKLNDESLIDRYEAERYAFDMNRTIYENVTAIANDRIQVCENGRWGVADSDGLLVIPCEYEKVSNYDRDRAIVMKDGEVYAVDAQNNRVALLSGSAIDIGNYGNDRVPVLTSEGRWQRATGEFVVGSTVFEEIGMYADGYAAAKQGGKWGVVDIDTNWLIPAEYDEIISDELGRVCGQNAVFVRQDSWVILFVNGKQTEHVYEDARPFGESGWAAVKKDGKWGFADTSGVFRIEPRFDDALSFGGHLAAVRQGNLWGYVALTGKPAIAPQFLGARSFMNGNAPVLTERGWQFIALIEYKKGIGL